MIIYFIAVNLFTLDNVYNQNNIQDIYGIKNFEYDGYKWNGKLFIKDN